MQASCRETIKKLSKKKNGRLGYCVHGTVPRVFRRGRKAEQMVEMEHYAFMIKVLELVKELKAREDLKDKLIKKIFEGMVHIVVDNEGLTRQHYEQE
jgi:hypothetical protein